MRLAAFKTVKDISEESSGEAEHGHSPERRAAGPSMLFSMGTAQLSTSTSTSLLSSHTIGRSKQLRCLQR
jgi:hypothetical protein